jgi:hypothetical protein
VTLFAAIGAEEMFSTIIFILQQKVSQAIAFQKPVLLNSFLLSEII